MSKHHNVNMNIFNIQKNSSNTSQQSQKQQDLNLCVAHPNEQITMFCTKCDKLVCRECTSTIHKKHEFSNLLEGKRNDFETILE